MPYMLIESRGGGRKAKSAQLMQEHRNDQDYHHTTTNPYTSVSILQEKTVWNTTSASSLTILAEDHHASTRLSENQPK